MERNEHRRSGDGGGRYPDESRRDNILGREEDSYRASYDRNGGMRDRDGRSDLNTYDRGRGYRGRGRGCCGRRSGSWGEEEVIGAEELVDTKFIGLHKMNSTMKMVVIQDTRITIRGGMEKKETGRGNIITDMRATGGEDLPRK